MKRQFLFCLALLVFLLPASVGAVDITVTAYRWNGNPFSMSDFYYGSATGVTHPSVLYFPGGEDNYKYWMYYTPYPPKEQENPSLVRSNDGYSWTTSGVNNPLTVPVAGAGAYLHDPDILKVGTNWYLVYGETHSSLGGGHALRMVTSTDGKNFGSVTTIFDDNAYTSVVGFTARSMSPSPWYESGTYYLFATLRKIGVDEGVISLAMGSNMHSLQVYGVVYDPPAPWKMVSHIDLIKFNGEYYIFCDYNTQWNAWYKEFAVLHATNFPYEWEQISNNPYMTYQQVYEAGGLYKPGPCVVDNQIVLFYSSKMSNNDHRIARADITINSSPTLGTLKITAWDKTSATWVSITAYLTGPNGTTSVTIPATSTGLVLDDMEAGTWSLTGSYGVIEPIQDTVTGVLELGGSLDLPLDFGQGSSPVPPSIPEELIFLGVFFLVGLLTLYMRRGSHSRQ